MRPIEHSGIRAALQSALASLRPPPKVALSQWIESAVFLPGDVSASPGRVRLWAPQRGIADAIGDPAVERVTVVKPVRVGLSTLLTSAVASFAANEPSPILVLLPTEDDCRRYVTSDLEPIFEASPELRRLLSADADPSGRNTLLSRRFPGGSLKIVASKSPRNLRAHNVRILLVDESDAMEVGKEGNPIDLAIKRTLSFPNRKIIIGSTPTFEETSNVLRSYRESDQRIFECPCPHCGEFTEIQWSHIQWEPDRPEAAAFACPRCGALTDERGKPGMIAQGRWRATRPEVTGHAGFKLSALVSTLANASWGKLAAEFIIAKRGPDTLQVFTNTILAQGWREAAEELNQDELAARVEDFGLLNIPAEVLFITAGVDVQRDRLEIVYLGHGKAGLCVLANQVIWGDPAADETVWAELDAVLRSNWQHPAGGTIRVDAAAIDAGDGNTMQRVLDFCRGKLARRIVAIKGAPGWARPNIQVSKTKGSQLYILGVDGLKQQLTDRITRNAGSVRFSADLEACFFDELASERLVLRYQRGAPVRQWERIPGRRAECLDCTCYALAVRKLIQMPEARREVELASVAAPPMRPTTIPSKWLAR